MMIDEKDHNPPSVNNEVPEDDTNQDSSGCVDRLLVPLVPIDEFPPFPTPRYKSQRNETLCGITMITVIAGILVGLTHGVALTIGFDIETHPVAWWIIFSLIYGEALVAMLLLAAILLVDPGVVPRTPTTCYPIPPSIAKWLTDGAKKEDKPSALYLPSLQKDCQDTYCTRCLVWRKAEPDTTTDTRRRKKTPESGTNTFQSTATETVTTTTIIETTTETQTITQQSEEPVVAPTNTTTTKTLVTEQQETANGSIKYFHCNTCQRCVRHFDHHCSFFGRCIAGSRTEGNLALFWSIIGVGAAAYLTCLGSVLAGLLHQYPVKWVLPLFGLGLMILHGSNSCLQRALWGLRRFFCQC
ncbi:expressed unknown protein [Seminavis robusta]|uniref:Palmitoyltransferase n=1 Tax=Seminavis robusta TaxID=568900 RepID=A0A9N8D8Y3_9STRA|nr:expressed unknown protein [Seminavis robusta]|eukprot:Sro19_g013510.1 n/a (356) ;mRNA; f:100134-101201